MNILKPQNIIHNHASSQNIIKSQNQKIELQNLNQSQEDLLIEKKNDNIEPLNIPEKKVYKSFKVINNHKPNKLNLIPDDDKIVNDTFEVEEIIEPKKFKLKTESPKQEIIKAYPRQRSKIFNRGASTPEHIRGFTYPD